jgi:DNA-directed RNA polymerase subunit RPC12/RpoP
MRQSPYVLIRTIIFWVIKLGSIECPKCLRKGYLVKERKKYLRVAHRFYGRTTFCYLGEIQKYFKRLELLFLLNPEKDPGDLVEKIKKILPKKPEEKSSTEIALLILELKKISWWLSKPTDGYDHKKRYEHKCPYCRRKIAIWVRRLGRPPYKHAYRDIWIETWKHF